MRVSMFSVFCILLVFFLVLGVVALFWAFSLGILLAFDFSCILFYFSNFF